MDDFWSANFWGILGTGIAVFSLIVSYLSFNYARPKIKISHATVYARKFDYEFMGKNKHADFGSFRNHTMRFTLGIRLANKKGGAGAISKPQIVIKIGEKRVFRCREAIVLDPQTEPHEGSFNLTGGQIIHDKLEYWLPDDAMHKLAQNIVNASYSIRFQTNLVKEKEHLVALEFTEH